MKINVSEIDENGFELNVVKSPEWVDIMNHDSLITLDSDLEIDIKIHKIVNELNLSGKLNFKFKTVCSLCLAEVSKLKEIPLRLVLSPIQEDEDENESDDDYEAYSGDNIDLTNYLKEQVVLSLPYKVLCSEGCMGLCSKCGKNLNTDKCECDTNWEDPRFAILKTVKV